MAGERSFTSFGAKVIDLEAAWRDRLFDANHLLKAGRYSTAISMGIYALEILLKVRICKRVDVKSLPRPFEIHDLSALLIVSGLSREMTTRNVRPIKANWNKIQVTAKGLNELRYLSAGVKSQEQAVQFFEQLNHPTNGVIPWIESRT